jgi:hypothetical protein
MEATVERDVRVSGKMIPKRVDQCVLGSVMYLCTHCEYSPVHSPDTGVTLLPLAVVMG